MSNRKRLATVAAIIAIVAIPVFADSAVDGGALFKSKCAMCHGPDGAGQTPMGKSLKLKDLRSAEVQKMTDKELNALISDGKGKMPAYKAKLSQAEIDALVGFIRSIKK